MCGIRLLIHSQLQRRSRNFIPHFIGYVITYPCWDWSQTVLVIEASWNKLYVHSLNCSIAANLCWISRLLMPRQWQHPRIHQTSYWYNFGSEKESWDWPSNRGSASQVGWPQNSAQWHHMSVIVFQTISLSSVCSTTIWDNNSGKYQTSALPALCGEIQQRSVNSPHKRSEMCKRFLCHHIILSSILISNWYPNLRYGTVCCSAVIMMSTRRLTDHIWRKFQNRDNIINQME